MIWRCKKALGYGWCFLSFSLENFFTYCHRIWEIDGINRCLGEPTDPKSEYRLVEGTVRAVNRFSQG